MSKKMTQCDRVLKYIKDFGSITTLQAFTDLGVTRLASRIHDLRVMGHHIQGNNKSVVNRYGDKVRVTEYVLIDR